MTTASKAKFRLVDIGWDGVLADACSADSSAMRLICPFIQKRPVERLLSHGKPGSLQVLTRFSLDDFCDRVSDIAAIRLLVESGAAVRGIRNLHAKMYLIGKCHAVVTSANLTDAALLRNHEFGFAADDPLIVKSCAEYFEKLWGLAGDDLSVAQIDKWETILTAQLVSGAPGFRRKSLGDFGTKIGDQSSPIVPAGWVAESQQAFVKFLGMSTNRKPLNYPIIDEVRRAGCHWACTYPKNKRPTRVRDGAMMFIGRLVNKPNDTRIFGRAIGMSYVEGRDDATTADMKAPREWKAKWPRYIRVHHAEFIDGSLGDGISLNELMAALGAKCFRKTLENSAKGHGNTNPRVAFSQQPHVELTPMGRDWLTERLELAFRQKGKQPDSVMRSLDWPPVPSMKQKGQH